MSESCSKEKQESKCCGTCGCRDAVAVTAAINDCSSRFLAQREQLFAAVNSYGSPLNIVFPDSVLENRNKFQAVLRERSISGEVLFTSKPNKSKKILSALASENSAVDVSSAGALYHALECGIQADRIQASGPKSAQYLFLALSKGATISIDSLDELEFIDELLYSNANLPNAKLLLRISGFKSERVSFTPSDAPFGFRVEKVSTALDQIAELETRAEFLGIHFHLLSGDGEERLVAFENAFESSRLALEKGLRPSIINVGGGFKIRYAAHREEWQRFQNYLHSSVLGKTKPITWDGSGLGLRVEDGRIAGAPAFADHYPMDVGAEALAKFLDQRSPAFDNCTVGELMRDMMLSLHVEPGRALLDQSGITIAAISAVKESAQGRPLLMLDMNHTNLLSREQKLLTQPYFIARGSEPRAESTKGYFLFGNLCIASDLIQYQKVYPGFEPQRGDLVAFVNTAAYHMDFAQAEILHQQVAQKVAAYERDGEFVLCADNEPSEDLDLISASSQELR